jgi:hypothetical protein
LLDGSLRLANGSDSLFDGLESHLGDDVTVTPSEILWS